MSPWLAILAAAGLALLAWLSRAERTSGAERGARWASARDLRVLRPNRRTARPAGGGRLALGTHRGRTLYAESRHALVAFGPPQSGKSAGLAIPALLEWPGPALASSIKTDL
ncbi:MAG TPA: hypothetical protein VFN48_02800, partial [Solirubrobacteraceae bacterium]|nr:hypothetical protein [Solirubrobacteraceae bacterium]